MTETESHTAARAVALGASTVLARRPSPTVEWVEVDGEIVAWNADGESLHLLDPIASLVFQLMDGEATLAVTIDDLAEAFGRPPEQIEPDVLRCAASLEEMGLLERVA
jgi:coenzyme PQQ synthesis protein D (PqqD)